MHPNSYLQQFAQMHPEERERLKQMFYANACWPPIDHPPQCLPVLQHPSPQLHQPPQTSSPLPSTRTRKRKNTPKRCVSTISQPTNPQLYKNNGNNDKSLFIKPLSAQVLNSNIIEHSNIHHKTGNNQSVDEEVIILEQEQPNSNQSFSRSSITYLGTPSSSKLYIVDNEKEETGSKEPASKILKALPSIPQQFSASGPSFQDLPAAEDTDSMTTSPLSSPTTSKGSTRQTPEFDFEKVKPLIGDHFNDKPMLKGFYTIIQLKRPHHLPGFLKIIGLAHKLQDQNALIENFHKFGQTNAENLYAAEKKKEYSKCSKCHKTSVALPNTLLSYLSEVGKNSSKEASEQLLIKIIECASEALSNAIEKVVKLNHENVSNGVPSSPIISRKLEDAAKDAFSAADNYEKCSVLWNSEPLRNIKASFAHDVFRMKIITEDEKMAILNEAECDHSYIVYFSVLESD